MLANNGGFKHLVVPLKGVTFVASGGQESEKHRLEPLDKMSIPVSNHSRQVLMISACNVPRPLVDALHKDDIRQIATMTREAKKTSRITIKWNRGRSIQNRHLSRILSMLKATFPVLLFLGHFENNESKENPQKHQGCF